MSQQPNIAGNYAEIHALMAKAYKEGYLHRVLVSTVDIGLNVLTGGMPDETISSRVRRVSDAHPKWGWNPGVWLSKIINGALNVLQKSHGRHAEAGDLARAERIEEIEEKSLRIKDQ